MSRTSRQVLYTIIEARSDVSTLCVLDACRGCYRALQWKRIMELAMIMVLLPCSHRSFPGAMTEQMAPSVHTLHITLRVTLHHTPACRNGKSLVGNRIPVSIRGLHASISSSQSKKVQQEQLVFVQCHIIVSCQA